MTIRFASLEELVAERNALLAQDGTLPVSKIEQFRKLSNEIAQIIDKSEPQYDLVIFQVVAPRLIVDVRPYNKSAGNSLGDTFRVVDASLDKSKFDLDIVARGTFKKGDTYK